MSVLGILNGNNPKLGTLVTGGPEDEIRRSIYRLARRTIDTSGCSTATWGSERTLRRQIDRYDSDGMEGLIDKRVNRGKLILCCQLG